jgi:hypothetical protein
LAIFLSFPSVAIAGGKTLIYYECRPNDHLIVRTFTLSDVEAVLNDDVLAVDQLTGVQTRECQVTPSDKVSIRIGISKDYPRNSNMQISINGHEIARSSFYDPNHAYTYIISKEMNVVSARVMETTLQNTWKDLYPQPESK